MVEVSVDGSGRCGGKLHGGEGVSVHHPDQHSGMEESEMIHILNEPEIILTEKCFIFIAQCVSCVAVPAAGLLRDPGADGSLVDLPEDALQAAALRSRGGVPVGGGGHGGGRHRSREEAGIR